MILIHWVTVEVNEIIRPLRVELCPSQIRTLEPNPQSLRI